MQMWVILAIVTVPLATYYTEFSLLILTTLSYFIIVCIGVIIGWYFVKTPARNVQPRAKKSTEEFLKKLTVLNVENNGNSQHSIVISRTVDSAIDEVIDLVLRDAVVTWLKEVVSDYQNILQDIKNEIWVFIANLYDRLSKVDQVKFLMQDVMTLLCQHYQRIRLATTTEGKDGKDAEPQFLIRPYLKDNESEIEFLRKLSEVIICVILPPSYRQSIPVRHLLREIIACQVLHPAIVTMSDPDIINQQLLSYLQYQQEMLEQHKRTYTYAANYEDFIKMIKESTNVEQIKHWRFNIMTEIMQATAIDNLKRAGKIHGLDKLKETLHQGVAGKGDMLHARNLKRYNNQLTFAKSLCERRIKALCGNDYFSSATKLGMSSGSEEESSVSMEKVMSFHAVMKTNFAQKYFMAYLEREDLHSLLEYWNDVEELKRTPKNQLHQMAGTIFQNYIPSVCSILKIDRSTLKGMEAFLIGNKGPDSFYVVQEEAYRYLEKRCYHEFLISDLYNKMILDAEDANSPESDFPMNSMTDDALDVQLDEYGTSENRLPETGNELSERNTFVKSKLQQIEEKLLNKLQAVKAMKASHKTDVKIISMLESEIEALYSEQEQLKIYSSQTESWVNHLGHWQVRVDTIEVSGNGEKEKIVPLYLISVYLNEEETARVKDEDECLTTSWILKCRYTDFANLQSKITQLSPKFRSLELPKPLRLKNKSVSNEALDRHKQILQKYLDTLLEDEVLIRSEMLYKFLSPAPDLMQGVHACTSPKKSKFSLASMLKSTPLNFQADTCVEDDFLFFEEFESVTKDDKIAEPLYNIIGEVFDMRGFSNLLCRTLMSFVQITFGKTINRQIREMVAWGFSEMMLVFYIQTFRDTFWPNGAKREPSALRTEEEMLKTIQLARVQLMNNIPDILNNLVGLQNARKGTNKIFESLQDVRLNKELIYEILELLVLEVMPEIKETKQSTQVL